MPEDERGPMLGPDIRQGGLYLPPSLGVQGRSLRVRVTTRWFRQEGHHLLAVVLASFPAHPGTEKAEARVRRDPVEPAAEGALPPEASHVSPDPDPDLLAGVLGVPRPEHA